MRRTAAALVCGLAIPGTLFAATRSFETAAFDSIAVSSGIEVDITVGDARSVVAATSAAGFDDLKIEVAGNVLKIGRPARNWFFGWFSGRRPDYQVRVATPMLASLAASSGAEVEIKGNLSGDFSVTASSGSEVEIAALNGAGVTASASSGSDLEINGTCTVLELEASSGSDLDADGLRCESVEFRASSGSDISATATKRVSGKASSGSDVRVRGNPPVVQVEKSSGADIRVVD